MGEYAPTCLSNMPAGVSILASKRTWKPRHVVRTFDAPPKLQGRSGAIRLRNWQEDVTAIVMSWLSKPKDAASTAACAVTLYSLAEWLRKTLQDTRNSGRPQRTDGCPPEPGEASRNWRPSARRRGFGGLLAQGHPAGRGHGSGQHAPVRSDKGKRCEGGLFDTGQCVEKFIQTKIKSYRLCR